MVFRDLCLSFHLIFDSPGFLSSVTFDTDCLSIDRFHLHCHALCVEDLFTSVVHASICVLAIIHHVDQVQSRICR